MKLLVCGGMGFIGSAFIRNHIAKNPNEAKKHKIAVVPTIVIFKDGEEVARFQADLSFKMVATREEVQEEIDNQLMSDF